MLSAISSYLTAYNFIADILLGCALAVFVLAMYCVIRATDEEQS